MEKGEDLQAAFDAGYAELTVLGIRTNGAGCDLIEALLDRLESTNITTLRNNPGAWKYHITNWKTGRSAVIPKNIIERAKLFQELNAECVDVPKTLLKDVDPDGWDAVEITLKFIVGRVAHAMALAATGEVVSVWKPPR